MKDRKIRMGMVGGGQGAMIGAVHRMAATMDGEIELVCGAFSSNPERSKTTGKELYLPVERIYSSWEEMISKEKTLPEGERMDFVSVVTPNFLHFSVAEKALENGFHVVCEKPMTFNLDEAHRLAKAVESSGKVFALTHNYTGYPMVKQAREIVRNGTLGKIRKVLVEYPQGWMATALEASGQKQASWRTDPEQAGGSCCMGDIGTHAENLTEYLTGLKIDSVCADLTSFVEGRQLDDDGNVLLRFDNGARGVLHASQVCVGRENDLHIRVYGEKAGLEWAQTEPNTLIMRWLDKPYEVLRTGANHPYLGDTAQANTRLPAGHPEGYIEAFANIYRSFASALRENAGGVDVKQIKSDFPTVYDGVRGMAFIETVVESSKSEKKWIKMHT